MRLLAGYVICAITHYPSLNIVVETGQAAMEVTGHCEDGSDDRIESSEIEEKGVMRRIGLIKTVEIDTAQLASKRIARPKNLLFPLFGLFLRRF